MKQYAINISGVIIKGDLGNIVQYRGKKTSRCEYAAHCKSFKSGNECKYWHPPEDYIKAKVPIPDNNIRNFTVGSWIYNNSLRPRNYYMRHIGSRDKIIQDLRFLPKHQYREEIACREGQLMHDLLIYMILNHQGLLERYHSWGNRT